MKLPRLLLSGVLALAASVPSRAQEHEPGFLTPARRWALVVGAGKYEHLGTLDYATADARLFAGALEHQLGFEPDTIKLLVDDAEEPELLPTAGHLLGELEALLADRRRTRSDLFVFYFCGHGVGREDGDFLLPTDARRQTADRLALPVREVVQRLAQAGMRNVLVVVDACRTGHENPFGAELWKLAESARIALVLGCEPGGQSYEDSTLGHGIFTQALVDALADPALVDPRSGALWASRVAAGAAERVRARTAKRDPAQRPAVWNDPTQDLLLALHPVATGLDSFVDEAGKLSPEARLAAEVRYAEELFFDDRYDECVELTRALEQVGELPPELQLLAGFSLQGMGRSVEAARAFQAVRTAAPESFQACVAALADRTGSLSATERAEAARALWDADVQVSFELLVAMVQALADEGVGELVLDVARTALEQAPPDTRDEAYLRSTIHALQGEPGPELEQLTRAEALPGDFPSDFALRQQRVQLAYLTQGIEAARSLLDECIAREPDEGAWYAWRAWLGRNAGRRQADLVAVRADAHAALQRTLTPEFLFMAVRALGVGALDESERVQELAAAYPLAWMAQIAAVFARNEEDSTAAVAEVARLAARPALVYVSFASLMLDACVEDGDRIVEERGSEPGVREAVSHEVRERYLQVVERLTPMAGDLGADVTGWNFLAEVYQNLGLHEPCARLFERHLAPLAEAQRLPGELVATFLIVAVNAGRTGRVEALLPQLEGPGAMVDALHWLAAAAAMVDGDESAVRARLGGRETVVDPAQEGVRRAVLAWLRLRAGDRDGARELLGEPDPESTFDQVLWAFVACQLGEVERARAIAVALDEGDPGRAYFALVGLWRETGEDPRLVALRGAVTGPGNPLARTLAFADGLEAFEGVQELELAEGRGLPGFQDATLTLTVRSRGRVLGTLEPKEGEPVPFIGQLDEFGNLTGELRAPSMNLTVLAKLAPPGFARGYDRLRKLGQLLLFLDGDGVAYVWWARFHD